MKPSESAITELNHILEPHMGLLTFEVRDDILEWFEKHTGKTYSDSIKQKPEAYDEGVHFHGPQMEKYEMRRMGKRMLQVFEIMADGQFRSIEKIRMIQEERYGSCCPDRSIGIYLRAFREKKYGAHTVDKEKMKIKGRVFKYKLKINGDPEKFVRYMRREINEL